METKLRSEQAKLALLEAEFQARFRNLIDAIIEDPIGPEPGQTVQDWLSAQGATIPDLPEWKTPLYLDKYVHI